MSRAAIWYIHIIGYLSEVAFEYSGSRCVNIYLWSVVNVDNGGSQLDKMVQQSEVLVKDTFVNHLKLLNVQLP